jgi:predicted Fe-S protein YdhL (DUF1289 family)
VNASTKITAINISSPCVDICCLDDHDICIGCLRSLDEIGEWSAATDERRRTIIQAAKTRQTR